MIAIQKFGLIPYAEAWELQRKLLSERIENKIPDTLLVLEHPHVITMGRKTPELGEIENRGDKEIAGVPLFLVERGGEATYHGPGQIVMYPIFRLAASFGPKAFLRLMENAIVDTLKLYDIQAFAIENATGVWLKNREGLDQKIASLGISVRSGVSYHGLALNVNTDLKYFQLIQPCGFSSGVMTSMQNIFAREFSIQDVGEHLAVSLLQKFSSLASKE